MSRSARNTNTANSLAHSDTYALLLWFSAALDPFTTHAVPWKEFLHGPVEEERLPSDMSVGEHSQTMRDGEGELHVDAQPVLKCVRDLPVQELVVLVDVTN